jgi:dTDP-4-amino-4,6-dideoxygalactose transaminase
MQQKIWLSPPHMGGSEEKYVKEAFDSNWIAPLGPNVDGFEKDIAKYTQCGHVAALSSGTAAIHLALVLLGVEPGDLVICQSFTFSASANPIRYQGAIPVFVDSEAETWNMCPEALESAIKACLSGKVSGTSKKGKKPKAIIPVHLYGMPAKMEAIMDVAAKYGIPVIEDAAEALGSSLKGRMCGTFGDLGVFSFNGNKIITTSGGGVLVGQDVEQINKARYLSTQARDPAPHYQHSEIGYNYRMSNVCAGIGRGQMEVLDQWVERRRNNHVFYKEALQDLSGLSFLEEGEGAYSNRWLTTVLVDPGKAGVDRMMIMDALAKENIESRPLWKPMHLQPVFRDYHFFGKNTCGMIFDLGICLPSGSSLTEENLKNIVRILKKVIKT